MSDAYTVLAILEAKPECVDELKQNLIAVVEPSRAEEYCVEYRLHQSFDNPCQFFFYEVWRDKQAHELHFTKPYIQDLASKIGDMIAQPFQIVTARQI